jgi:hypothetical protein
VHPVVAPVALAGKLGNGHQLQRRDAETSEFVEVGNNRLEGALGRAGSDVNLLEDLVAERESVPVLVGPAEVRINDL